MKTAFVTGGSGFIGQALIRQLVAKGVQVRGLARSPRAADAIGASGAIPYLGDLHNHDTLVTGMNGCDVVFHLAGIYELGFKDWREMEYVNVEGTRRVIQAALEANVNRIVYTSTIGIYGDTRGQVVNEGYRTDHQLDSHYERTKWRAHYDVVLPMIEAGAPVTIVQPGLVYGPKDHSIIHQLMERFYHRRFPFPILFGPETKYSLTHVEDAAHGHILAAEKGKAGESYILAGPAVSQGDLVDVWARLIGRSTSGPEIPANVAKLLIPLFATAERYVELPEIFTAETINRLGYTYTASSDKARSELGWRPRPLQEGMLESLKSIADRAAEENTPTQQNRALLAIGGGLAVFLLTYWLYRQSRRSSSGGN